MKIPKARRLPSGMYNIQLRLDGESISITESTKAKCEAEARYIKSQHKAGKRKKPVGADMTLKQAIDAYIQSRDNLLSPSTIRGYDAILNNRFQNLMDKRLADINWQEACNNETVAIKKKKCEPAETKKISGKYLKNTWGLVSSVLKYHKLEVPTVSLPQVAKKNKAWIEPSDIHKFLDAVKGNEYEFQIILALHGLRNSEILKVDESKIQNGFITVSGAVVCDKDGKFVDKETNKNRSSQRIVPVLIPRLNEVERIPCHPNTIRVNINRICKKIGLPEVGTHGLRRSFASLCYHLGLSERETMELGGWSDANTMREIYIHLAQKDKEKASKKLANFFDSAYKNANETPE